MNQFDQTHFVEELCDNIKFEIIGFIIDGKIPDHWDGHEFRILLAEKFAASGRMSTIWDNPKSSRARSYRNHVTITPNLT